MPQQHPPPRRPGKGRPRLIIGIVVLAVVLLAGGWALFGQDVFGGNEPNPSPSAPHGQGELPELAPLEVPEVINEAAAVAGLTCHDEATTTVKVRGCYLHDPGHLITLRFLIDDDGQIEKLSATVLNNGTSPQQRGEEILDLMDPLLSTLPISETDRDVVSAAVRGTETNVSEETQWGDGEQGRFNYRFSTDTSSMDIGKVSFDFTPTIPLAENPTAVVEKFEELGWECEEEEEIITTCFGHAHGKVVLSASAAGLNEGESHLVGFQLWFDGRVPVPDEPRMEDAYTVLASTGEKGEAMAVGLRMLAEGEKQFFNSDVEFYRGDSYYELRGVHFI